MSQQSIIQFALEFTVLLKRSEASGQSKKHVQKHGCTLV